MLILIVAILLSSQAILAKDTIEWWQFWTDPAIKPTMESMVEEFEQANPDIDVKLTDLTWANGHEKIAIAFASGSGPDVVELGSDWIAQFAANGHLADLSSEIAADSNDFDGWGMATYQGAVYGQPWILGTRVLYVNLDLAERAGHGTNYLPADWIKLLRRTRDIHLLGDDIYGWGSNTPEKHRLYKKFLPFVWSNRADVFTSEDEGNYCVISSRHVIEAMSFYKLLHDSCGYVGSQRNIEDAFLDGKIGYIISGDWLLKRIKLEKRDINFTTLLIPGSGTDGKVTAGKSFLGGEFLAVNSASDNPEAAKKLVDFITQPKNQVRFCKANHSANPSSRAAQEDEYFVSDPNLQTFIVQLRYAVHPPVDPNWVYIEEEIEKAVEAFVFGTTSAATALYNASVNINKIREK